MGTVDSGALHSLTDSDSFTQSLDKCLHSTCHLTGPGGDPGYTEMSEMNQLPFLGAWAEEPESDSESQK